MGTVGDGEVAALLSSNFSIRKTICWFCCWRTESIAAIHGGGAASDDVDGSGVGIDDVDGGGAAVEGILESAAFGRRLAVDGIAGVGWRS
ncbi:unnamed protein product [Heligmosomoides polygyrus]|uniref:Secreted protein n=1 Tax=Heligmosomoides polygyrus TaxID=6339 RepID=A0A183FTB7_HELPZ|nr:unnamed protein product [Heligmosomoides polygyrus]